MKHNKKTPKLSLKPAPRKALLRSLVTSLVIHGRIKTTLPKAKALRGVVEKRITIAKKNDLAARRRLLSYIYNEKAVKKLLEEIAPKYLERKGGYTRIIKLENRKGDNAAMAIIELV